MFVTRHRRQLTKDEHLIIVISAIDSAVQGNQVQEISAIASLSFLGITDETQDHRGYLQFKALCLCPLTKGI
jgi:hypothetical protein